MRYKLGRWRYAMHWRFRVTAWMHWNGKRYASRIAGRMRWLVFANGPSRPRWRFRGMRLDPPEPPYADFHYAPATPSVSAATNTVSFQEHAFDLGPRPFPIIDYAWEFGDPASGAANSSDVQDPVHTFVTPGAYPVTLTVTDEDGMTDSDTQIVTVAHRSAGSALHCLREGCITTAAPRGRAALLQPGGSEVRGTAALHPVDGDVRPLAAGER